MTAHARFEVWGDPISHSLSPALHSAAYAELGWPWEYGRRRVDEESFAREWDTLDRNVRGLSLTMPLKTLAFEAGARRDAAATATAAANTLVRTTAGAAAFNTDVDGLVRALREVGAADAARARIVGAGATATSALVALSRLGVREVDLVARRPEAAEALRPLADDLGLSVRVSALDAPGTAVDLTVSTLPGDAPLDARVAGGLAIGGGILFDVVYGSWPTVLGRAWQSVDAPAHSGLGMLLHQAVLQIRIFATGEPTQPLPGEDAVVAIMRRAAVGG